MENENEMMDDFEDYKVEVPASYPQFAQFKELNDVIGNQQEMLNFLF